MFELYENYRIKWVGSQPFDSEMPGPVTTAYRGHNGGHSVRRWLNMRRHQKSAAKASKGRAVCSEASAVLRLKSTFGEDLHLASAASVEAASAKH